MADLNITFLRARDHYLALEIAIACYGPGRGHYESSSINTGNPGVPVVRPEVCRQGGYNCNPLVRAHPECVLSFKASVHPISGYDVEPTLRLCLQQAPRTTVRAC